MKKLLLSFLLFAGFAAAQTSPCGSAPHCVVVSWTAGVGGDPATSFNVQRSTTTGGPYTQIATTPATLTTYTDLSATGNVLAEGTTYFYVVNATGTGGTSANSNEASAKIPFLPPAPPTGTSAIPH